nr:MAG TPA: hypothetical protein [Bacteriophage sp.]
MDILLLSNDLLSCKNNKSANFKEIDKKWTRLIFSPMTNYA